MLDCFAALAMTATVARMERLRHPGPVSPHHPGFREELNPGYELEPT